MKIQAPKPRSLGFFWRLVRSGICAPPLVKTKALSSLVFGAKIRRCTWGTEGVHPALKVTLCPFEIPRTVLEQEREQISGKWSVAWPGMWHLRSKKQFIRIWCTLAWSCSELMPTQIKQLASREDVYFDDDHANREHWRSRWKDTQSQAWNRRRSQLGWAASQTLPTCALLVWGSSVAAKRLWSPP